MMKKEDFILQHGEEAWDGLVEPVLQEVIQKHYSPIAETTREDVIDCDVIVKVLTLLGFKKTDSLLETKKLIQKYVPKKYLKI